MQDPSPQRWLSEVSGAGIAGARSACPAWTRSDLASIWVVRQVDNPSANLPTPIYTPPPVSTGPPQGVVVDGNLLEDAEDRRGSKKGAIEMTPPIAARAPRRSLRLSPYDAGLTALVHMVAARRLKGRCKTAMRPTRGDGPLRG